MSHERTQSEKRPRCPRSVRAADAGGPVGHQLFPDEVKRKFNVNSAREDVVRQRAYEIYEQHGREEGYALDHWLQAEYELK